MQLRQIFRGLSKTYRGRTKVRELLARYKNKLSNNEYWIIQYTYAEEQAITYVCELLGFSKTLYHNTLNTALSRLEILIDDATLREIIKVL